MSQNVQRLPEQRGRVETGAVQFGEDWPGLFIRGDNAFYYAILIRQILDRVRAHPINEMQTHVAVAELEGLATMIENDVIVKPPSPPASEA